MKIVMIGSGYVGLVSGICFADFGHDVVCVDTDTAKVEDLKAGCVPIYEPGLEALLERNVEAGRIAFTTNLEEALDGAQAAFIGVGTPARRGDGAADLTYVYAAARQIGAAMDPGTVVVTKSTVPVGTNREVKTILEAMRPKGEAVHVASNPEFLREGAAIEDFMRPDRVVVGVETDHAREILEQIYRPLYLRDFPLVITDLESAEIIKYAANAFLATKITFINEIAGLCEAVGADVKNVSHGIGLDGRIGDKFLKPGPGYGGSCFPKDTAALARMAQDAGAPISIVDTVMKANEAKKMEMKDKIVDLLDGDVRGKAIAVLGVTFKPETDDMREAPSLTILPPLLEAGADIRICDPQGRKEGATQFVGATWAADAYEAAAGADAVVVLTEWNEFRALDLEALAGVMRTPRMADLRNIYNADMACAAGFGKYICVGRRMVV